MIFSEDRHSKFGAATAILLIIAITSICFPSILNGQSNVTDSIVVEYHLSGDYRWNTAPGYRIEHYKTVYYPDSTSGMFRAEGLKMKRMAYRYDFEDENSPHITLSSDSTIEIQNEAYVAWDEVNQLKAHAEISKYNKLEISDTIYLETNSSPGLIHNDTLYVIKHLSIEDYGLDSLDFVDDCEYFRRKIYLSGELYAIQLPQCEEEPEFSLLLNSLIRAADHQVVKSSYRNWVVIRFFEDGRRTAFSQRYPGGIHTGWYIHQDGKETFKAVNPNINWIGSKLMSNFETKADVLLEYQQTNRLVKEYLTAKIQVEEK